MDLLYADIQARRLSRRDVLKRATALGLSAPVIGGLLAACGGDDPVATAVPAATAPAPAPVVEPTATEAEQAATAQPGAPTNTAAPAPTTPPAPAATPDPAAQAGGHGLVRLLWWQAPTILNSHLAQGGKDFDASRVCLEPLADFNNSGTLMPILAAEIPSLENGDVAADGMSVTWRLREGVTWHDGEPFTSADVAFTYDFATHPDAATVSKNTYRTIESIETPDDLTVVINFLAPTAAWFEPFIGLNGRIIPMHILEEHIGAAAVDAPYNLKPIGTGPFMVTEFRPGDVVLYDRYEGYWDPGKPHFDQVELKGGGDATSAARAALQTGEVDWAWNLQVEAQVLLQMEADGDGILLSLPGPGVERVLVNFTDPNTEVDGERSHISVPHPFLSELEARTALTYACDRDTIAEQLYGPTGVATSNIITAPDRFVSPNTSYEFSLETAAQMLEDAGWAMDGNRRTKNGYTTNFLFNTSTNPLRQKTQEILKQDLESIGIGIEIKAVDAAVFFASDPGNPDTYAHFYCDIQMFTNSGAYYPLDYVGFYSSLNPELDIAQESNGWSGRNIYRWVNEEYNALFEQIKTELDPARQDELFIGMNDLIVMDVCEIPLVARAGVSAHSADLTGIDGSGWAGDLWNIKDWGREGM
ncbi:MAG TPA: peptide ABC transporter substrate-binding protein [Thermomicrobiales bacterium]|nr:peptide ABC transporter substrate-binding protein [Thermomicrobiales bacterium]